MTQIMKLWVDNNEGIVYTLDHQYRNENNVQHDKSIAYNDEGWED
jgi:hypothetical protein